MNSPRALTPGTRSPPNIKTLRSSSLPVPKGVVTNTLRVNREDTLRQLLTTLATVTIRFPKESNNKGEKAGEAASNPDAKPQSLVYRCEKYEETILSRLNEQRRKESKLCDVVLQYGSQKILAHRCILASSSKYFNELFETVAESVRAEKLVISEMNEDALNSLIDFFYSGEIKITTDNVQKLSATASVLKVEEVLEGCCQFLADRLAPMNCLSILRFARMIQNSKLEKACLNYSMQHFDDMMRDEDELRMLDQEQFEQLISFEDSDLSEDERLKAILTWVSQNATARNHVAPSLCKRINISKLSKRFLQQLCLAEEKWKNSSWLNKFLMQALLCQLLPEEQKLNEDPSYSQVIVAVGGGLAKNTVECFNVEANAWISVQSENKRGLPFVPNLPRARHGCAAVVVDNILYVLGGHTDGATASVLIYDEASQSWKEGEPMQRPRRWLGATVLNQTVYAIGGNDGSTRLDSGEVYDIATGKWSFIAPMSYPRSSHGVAAWQNRIYAVGGFTADDIRLSSAESYNPETDNWTRVTKMNSPRCGLGLCLLENRLYAVGGWSTSGTISKTAEVFSPESNSWINIASMNVKRGGLGLVAYGQCLYAVGGWDGEQRSDTIEKYDPKNDAWTSITERMQTSRYNAGVAVLQLRNPD